MLTGVGMRFEALKIRILFSLKLRKPQKNNNNSNNRSALAPSSDDEFEHDENSNPNENESFNTDKKNQIERTCPYPKCEKVFMTAQGRHCYNILSEGSGLYSKN